MRMRSLSPIAVFIAALVALACSSDTNECAPTGLYTPSADVLSLSEDDFDNRGWREHIADLVASAPPDSIVNVQVLYNSGVTEEDRALLDELDAHVSYVFNNVPALTVHISVAGLATLAESDRVRSIGLGIAYTPDGC